MNARVGRLPLGVPEVWLLPTGQVAIRVGEDSWRVVEPEDDDHEVYELPADAVRLVPAGGPAPADEVERLKLALAGHIFDGESMNTREAIRHELILIGQEHGAEVERMRPVVEAATALVDEWPTNLPFGPYQRAVVDAVAAYRAGGTAPADNPDDVDPPTCPECGHASDHSGGECMWFDDYLVNGRHEQVTCKCPGSAPHQGATTDATALLAHLDWLDERAMKGHHLLLRTDDVRALLAGKSIPIGPSADRALLGAGETTEETHG